MAKDNVLLDSYCIEGTDINDFFKNVQEMADRTYISGVYGRDVAFLSAYNGKNVTGYKGADINNAVAFRYLSKEAVQDIELNNKQIPVGFIRKDMYDEDVIDETLGGTGLMVCVEAMDKAVVPVAEKMFISTNCMKTITQRAAVSGGTIFSEKNIFRDSLLASSIYNRNEKIKFVYRRSGNTTKLFAAFSEYYPKAKQDMLVTAMQREDFPFKDYVLKEYRITNFLTEAILVKPCSDTSTGIIPGIKILNSDVGRSYFTIRNIFLTENSYVVQSEESAKHSSSLNVDKMITMFKRAKESLECSIFSEEMEKLKGIVFPYCGSQNKKNANEFIKSVFKTIYKEVMSKKSFLIGVEKLESSLSDEKSYTCYDFAELIVDVSSYYEDLDESTQLLLHRAAYNAPVVLVKTIEKIQKKS